MLVLIFGASLLTRSFSPLIQVEPGFQTEHLLTANLAIPRSKYPMDRQVAEFCSELTVRLQHIPGVAQIAMVNRLPLAYGTQTVVMQTDTGGTSNHSRLLPGDEYSDEYSFGIRPGV